MTFVAPNLFHVSIHFVSRVSNTIAGIIHQAMKSNVLFVATVFRFQTAESNNWLATSSSMA
jgi:hypothetical protein